LGGMSKPGFSSSKGRGEAKEPHHRRGIILDLYMEFIRAIGTESECQKRNEVVEMVKNYLNLVGTPAKFITDDFLDVFSSCIEAQNASMKSVDLSAVVGAFSHLENFALRLLAEPWRTEFRLLRLYNSLFVNSILPFVNNAPKIFTCLGYEVHSSQSQTLFLPCSKPLDVKAVSAVACDLLIAASELCFMTRVLAKLEAKGLTLPLHDNDTAFRPVSIHDIWKERQSNIGSVDSCLEHISQNGRIPTTSSSSSSSRDKSTFRSSSASPSRHSDPTVTGPLPRFPGSVGGNRLSVKQSTRDTTKASLSSSSTASSTSVSPAIKDTQPRPNFGSQQQRHGVGAALSGAGNAALGVGAGVDLLDSLNHHTAGRRVIGGAGVAGNENQRLTPNSHFGSEGRIALKRRIHTPYDPSPSSSLSSFSSLSPVSPHKNPRFDKYPTPQSSFSSSSSSPASPTPATPRPPINRSRYARTDDIDANHRVSDNDVDMQDGQDTQDGENVLVRGLSYIWNKLRF